MAELVASLAIAPVEKKVLNCAAPFYSCLSSELLLVIASLTSGLRCDAWSTQGPFTCVGSELETSFK